jgi:hypothetical protein
MNFPLDLAVVDLTKKGRFPRENKAEIHKKQMMPRLGHFSML